MIPLTPHESIVSLHDLARLCLRHKIQIICAALYLGLFGLFYACSQPIQYKIEATFKEQADIKTEGALKEFREALGFTFDLTQTPSIMKSHQVLKPLISRLGLQIELKEPEDVKLQWNYALRAEAGIRLPDRELFRFRDVFYEGECPGILILTWKNPEHFAYQWNGHNGKGSLGKEVNLPGLRFTISNIPKEIEWGKSFLFIVSPWLNPLSRLRRDLLIKNHKQNQSLYLLSLKHPHRFLGAEIVNELMNQYQKFVREEYDRRIDIDLAFLRNKKQEAYKELVQTLEEKKEYLQKNVDALGFFDLKQEAEEFAIPYRDLFLRSCALEIEEKQLDAWNEHESLLLLERTAIGAHLHRFHVALEDLYRERDLLEKDVLREQETCSLDLSSFQFDLVDLDFETARRLLIEQNRILDESKSSRVKLKQIQEGIEAFSLESISILLSDEVSQRLIASVATLQTQLSHSENYTSKELVRAERDLILQKRLLKEHVERLQEAEELREKLIQQKIAYLQRATLDCIQRQIANYKEQIADQIHQRKESIKQERGLLGNKMRELRKKMQDFPEKWFSERNLELHVDAQTKLSQAINQLVETKEIGRNLYHVASKPLDLAVPPILAKRPGILFYTFGGLGLGSSFVFVILFSIGVFRGFPVGSEKLKALHRSFSGFLGKSQKQDFESISKAELFVEGKQKIGLIGARSEDLSLFTSCELTVSQEPLDHFRSLALLRCEAIIVVIREEPMDLLLPYLNHPYATFLIDLGEVKAAKKKDQKIAAHFR